eukprot:scaffold244342_cov26-Tisochrysis_lutea.AAC.1
MAVSPSETAREAGAPAARGRPGKGSPGKERRRSGGKRSGQLLYFGTKGVLRTRDEYGNENESGDEATNDEGQTTQNGQSPTD